MHRRLIRAQASVIGVVLMMTITSSRAHADEPVQIRPDVVYGHKDGMALTMDALLPPKPNGAGVLFIQSGGWHSGWRDPATRVPFFQPLLDKGFVVFIVRHGSAPRYGIAEALGDVRRAVRFTRLRAADFGISADRIGAMGISAGGHLSLMLATTGDDGDAAAKEDVLRQPSRVAAVVAICAPTDIRTWVTDPPPAIRAHAALKAPLAIDADAARALSPIVHVTEKTAPVLLVHGGKDELVPPAHSEQMAVALKSANVPHRLLIVPDATHGNVEHKPESMPAIVAWFEERLGKK